MSKKLKKTTSKKVEKNSDLPATHGELLELRAEFKADITSVKLDMRAMEKRVDAKFVSLEAKFDTKFIALDVKIDQSVALLRSEIVVLSSEIQSLTAAVHRTLAIVEEQNARNQFVLDGYKF